MMQDRQVGDLEAAVAIRGSKPDIARVLVAKVASRKFRRFICLDSDKYFGTAG
jgi:hypothetical protein